MNLVREELINLYSLASNAMMEAKETFHDTFGTYDSGKYTEEEIDMIADRLGPNKEMAAFKSLADIYNKVAEVYTRVAKIACHLTDIKIASYVRSDPELWEHASGAIGVVHSHFRGLLTAGDVFDYLHERSGTLTL
jgi:hypothetical protein